MPSAKTSSHIHLKPWRISMSYFRRKGTTHVGPMIKLMPFRLKINSPSIWSLNCRLGGVRKASSSSIDHAKSASLNPIIWLSSSSSRGIVMEDRSSLPLAKRSRSSVFCKKWLIRSRETFPMPGVNHGCISLACHFSPSIIMVDCHEIRWSCSWRMLKPAMLENIVEADYQVWVRTILLMQILKRTIQFFLHNYSVCRKSNQHRQRRYKCTIEMTVRKIQTQR